MDGLVFSELTPEWVEQAHELEHKTFFTVKSDDLYSLDEMAEDLAKLPGGNFMVVDPTAGNRLVGMGLGTLIDVDPTDPELVLSEIDGVAEEKEFSLDNPWYYGTSIAVDPEYRGRGIGHQLYVLRKGFVQSKNKAGIVAGGVLPGYKDYVEHLTADEYIEKVKTGKLYDRTLSFQLREGFQALRALPNYLRDVTVNNCASLIVWDNPDYRPDRQPDQ